MPILRPLTATDLSRYVRLERCERFLWFRLKRDETYLLEKQLQVKAQPLSPLLTEAGEAFEQEVVNGLGVEVQNLFSTNQEETIKLIQTLTQGQSVLLTQAMLKAQVGDWPCEGRADLIRATRLEDNSFEIMIGDMKSSRHDRVEYRLQVAFYLRLLILMLEENGSKVSRSVGAVLHKQTDNTLPSLDDPARQFELEPYNIVLTQLLEGSNTELSRLARLTQTQLSYSLGYKCDGCAYNQLCMADSNQNQDVTLVPFIQPAAVQALRQAGVGTLRELAELKILPPSDWNVSLKPDHSPGLFEPANSARIPPAKGSLNWNAAVHHCISVPANR